MAIQQISYANALLVSDPKYIVVDGNNATVYTGADYNAQVTLSRAVGLPNSLLETYPEDSGATSNNVRASAFVTTNAIHAKIATGKKVKFGHGDYWVGGIVIDSTHTEAHLEGSGFRKSKIWCYEAGVDVIRIIDTDTAPFTGVYPHDIYQYPVIQDMALIGNQANGTGIVISGVAWYTLDDLFIKYMGGHGIHITESSPPSVAGGSFIGSIKNCKISWCLGDGIRQISVSPSSQQNASRISMTELQYCSGNGATLWGYQISVKDNTIEGNTGYGIELHNHVVDGTGDSAKVMVINDNYFEANRSGHLHVRTNTSASEAGNIVGLSIQNNFGFIENGAGSGLDATYVDVKFSTLNSNPHNQARAVTYRGNYWTHRVDNTVEADFGNMLAHDCVVAPQYTLWSTTIWADIDRVFAKHINLGNAKFDFIKSKVCQGLWDAKGGSGITYSTLIKSDNITVSGSNTFFPLGDIPLTAVFMPMSVYVDTDSTSFSITFEIQSRSFDSVDGYVTRVTKTIANKSGAQVIKTDGLSSNGIAFRQDFTHLDSILKITVTITTPGTYLYLGNPTVLYSI